MNPTRRSVLAAASVLALSTPFISRTYALSPEPYPEPYKDAVIKGVEYLRERAGHQLLLAQDLTRAIRSGDVLAAQQAYEAARPPYEEIEVHAWAFSEIDADIDARPYAFVGGETNPAFRGFHRIEALLYRDRDPAAALSVAEETEASIVRLQEALSQNDKFNATQVFEGLVALPEEVASKKISSEEETWSDLSLIIFRHNFVGVQSQFAPFAEALEQVNPARLEAAQMAFVQAHAMLEPFFEGPNVTRYSDVRTRERAAISRTAYAIRSAMEGAAEALTLV